MNIKCIIVDDEPLARNVIRNHLEQLPHMRIAGECKNAMEALSLLRSERVDLVFLDIQMPGLSGLDFLKTLAHPPRVIIVTAFRDYAIEGYELNVVDYLLKPVSFERFLQAVNKYSEISDYRPVVLSDNASGLSPDEFIYVKENKKVRKIYLSEIRYIESLREYIHIHVGDNRVIAKLQIGYMEKQLPPDHFLRVHKSYLVGLAHVKAFTANRIEVGSQQLPISRNYKESVLRALQYQDKSL